MKKLVILAALSAAVGVLVAPGTANATTPQASALSYARAQLGLRVKNLWLIGGLLRRDSVVLSPPTIFNPTHALCSAAQLKIQPACNQDTLSLVTTGDASATGITAGVRGQVALLGLLGRGPDSERPGLR